MGRRVHNIIHNGEVIPVSATVALFHGLPDWTEVGEERLIKLLANEIDYVQLIVNAHEHPRN